MLTAVMCAELSVLLNHRFPTHSAAPESIFQQVGGAVAGSQRFQVKLVIKVMFRKGRKMLM